LGETAVTYSLGLNVFALIHANGERVPSREKRAKGSRFTAVISKETRGVLSRGVPVNPTKEYSSDEGGETLRRLVKEERPGTVVSI